MNKITLKRIREDCGMTRKEVAEKVGLSERAIAQYEQGTRSPSIDTVLVLAHLYGESAEDIIVAVVNSRQRARGDSQH